MINTIQKNTEDMFDDTFDNFLLKNGNELENEARKILTMKANKILKANGEKCSTTAKNKRKFEKLIEDKVGNYIETMLDNLIKKKLEETLDKLQLLADSYKERKIIKSNRTLSQKELRSALKIKEDI